MKNILMITITILLAVIVGIVMIKGIAIGNIQVLSIEQIKQKNSELKDKSLEANNLNLIEYKEVLEKLQTAQKQLQSNKSDYLDIASTSTDDEIKEANQTQVYAMEFLWSKVGNHATENGVNLRMDVTETDVPEKKTLEFLAIGNYIAIRDFVYSLENDKDLNFRIQNFKLIDFKINANNKDEKYKEDLLQASFAVDNIEIKEENVTTKVETSDSKQKTQTPINVEATNVEAVNVETIKD